MCSIKSVNGFKILPLKFSSNSTSCHELFIKEHSVRGVDETKPAGKTLFILNIPPYANSEEHLKIIFSEAGQIENVIIQTNFSNEENNSDIGFKVAYIVFKTRDSLLKVLKLNSLKPLSTDSFPIATGMEKWIQSYNNSIYNPQTLTKEANQYMLQYDDKEDKNTKQKDEVDDEGWTVVTKKSRNPGLARKESVVNKLNEKIGRGAKKKELKNFYTFQIRENKMKNLAELRKSYEEAKNKVKQMKNIRRFKPY